LKKSRTRAAEPRWIGEKVEETYLAKRLPKTLEFLDKIAA
jgi:hypothetical protein